MSKLQVRTLPFNFDGDIEFIWNPANPGQSIKTNAGSFFVQGLEWYFCQIMRDAEPLIKNPEVLEEARLFRAQEAVHSAAHRRHTAALIRKYPGLKDTP